MYALSHEYILVERRFQRAIVNPPSQPKVDYRNGDFLGRDLYGVLYLLEIIMA